MKAGVSLRRQNEYNGFVIRSAIGDRNYSSHNEYKKTTMGIRISADTMIRSNDEVDPSKDLVHIESKSYMDMSMAKRFLTDSAFLLHTQPQLMNVALCLQPATPIERFIRASKIFSDIKYGENVFSLQLVERPRSNLLDRTYMLHLDKVYLEDRTHKMIEQLEAIIP
jgi:hypothetical protein